MLTDKIIKAVHEDIPNINSQLEQKIYYFNTISELKNSNKLKNGDFALTLGFYSKNDGGGAKYIITDGGTNDGFLNHKLNNKELYANLIIENNILNIRTFGAIGDGVFDNTNILNKVIELSEGRYDIFIPNGVFYLANSLNVPTFRFRMFGKGLNLKDSSFYKPTSEYPQDSPTIRTNKSLFDGNDDNKILMCDIENILFGGNRTSPLFNRVKLDGCNIKDNVVFWYTTFVDGMIRYVTRITNNRFYYLENSFFQCSLNPQNCNIFDSIIEKNEIMGVPGVENICFINNEFAMSYIRNNYIEFFSFNYKPHVGSGDVIGVLSDGNVYDYFLEMTPKNCGLAGGTFTNETFSNVNKTSAEKWGQPTNLYDGNDMTVFRFANGLYNNGLVVENCKTISVANFAKFDNFETTKRCSITINNIRAHSTGAIYGGFPMTFANTGEAGYYNFTINYNTPLKVTELPGYGYNGQMVIKDKLYYYWNGSWH